MTQQAAKKDANNVVNFQHSALNRRVISNPDRDLTMFELWEMFDEKPDAFQRMSGVKGAVENYEKGKRERVPVVWNLREVLGLPPLPGKTMDESFLPAPGYSIPHPETNPFDTSWDKVEWFERDYQFSDWNSRSVVESLAEGDHLALVGPKGSGKSSFYRNLLVRLGYGFEVQTSKADLNEWIGHWLIGPNGTTTFGYKPFARGAMTGKYVICDEYDTLDEDFMADFHTYLDGNAIENLANDGEVIPLPRGFSLLATGNRVGHTDETQMYGNTKEHGAASMSRFVFVYGDYMAPDQELALLSSCFPDIEEVNLQAMLNFAIATREMHKGEYSNGSSPEPEGVRLDNPMSTRELKRWIRKDFNLSDADPANEDGSKLFETLEQVYLNALSSVDRSAALSAYRDIVGAN